MCQNRVPSDPSDRGATRSGRCLLYTSPSPRDYAASRMPSSAWKMPWKARPPSQDSPLFPKKTQKKLYGPSSNFSDLKSYEKCKPEPIICQMETKNVPSKEELWSSPRYQTCYEHLMCSAVLPDAKANPSFQTVTASASDTLRKVKTLQSIYDPCTQLYTQNELFLILKFFQVLENFVFLRIKLKPR